jgi:predicted permease
VLLRPFDYRAPDRLVLIQARLDAHEIENATFTGSDVKRLRAEASSYEAIAAVTGIRQNLTGSEVPRQVNVGWASDNLFTMLGVGAAIGRTFVEGDPPGTAVLGYGTWQDAFGGDPGVFGRTIHLDGHPYTVVGVVRPGFRLHLPGENSDFDVWKVPDNVWQNGDVWGFTGEGYSAFRLLARLKPGVTVEQANAEAMRLRDVLIEGAPNYTTLGLALDVAPLHERVVRNLRPTLLLLLGAAGLVLLVACANVTNLMLVRTQARRHEVVLRRALGSGRGGIIRLLLAEGLLLAGAGGVAGIALALWALRAIEQLRPPELARLDAATLDGRMLAFAAVLAVLCTIAVGLVPAFGASRSDLMSAMRSSRQGGGRTSQRFGRGLTVAQIASSLVLLIGAGLLTASLMRLQSVRPGFDPENVLTFAVSLPGTKYERPVGTDRFLVELEDRIRALPGVRDAGVVWPLPLSGQMWSSEYSAGAVRPDAKALAGYRLATPAWFRTAGVRLAEGRIFGPADRREVVVISRGLAERAWPGESPLGRTIDADPWGSGATPFEVVGVVDDVRHADLRDPPIETMYFDSRGWSWTDWEVFYMVRAEGDPVRLVEPIRRTLLEMDPEIPLADARPMAAYLGEQLASNRFALSLIGLFAAVAAILAVIGLYGVVSYSASRRVREIGIRMALGSRAGEIRALVLGQGLRLALAGIGLGVIVAIALTRLLGAYLYGVEATDPGVFAGIAGLLALVTVAACWFPARRAMRVDAMAVLRGD